MTGSEILAKLLPSSGTNPQRTPTSSTADPHWWSLGGGSWQNAVERFPRSNRGCDVEGLSFTRRQGRESTPGTRTATCGP